LLASPESLELLPFEALRAGPTARLLARAFADNPLVMAAVGGSEKYRYRNGLHGMRSLLASARGRSAGWIVRDAGQRVPRGALVGPLPPHHPLPPAPFLWQLRALLGQGPRIVARWGRVYERLQSVHPLEPHAYLGTLGVDPTCQGRGYGGALLEHWLRSVDEARLPSYLETDRERNVGFYSRAGFEVAREISVLGVPIWCMWREAARAGGMEEPGGRSPA
jgi:ribosomal protein S18 acetylase RimI-like enzyme